MIPLSEVVKYSTTRIDSRSLPLQNFVTTDSILQNKAGLTDAINLPPSDNALHAYAPGNILIGNIRPYLKKIWFADRYGGSSADVLVFEVNKSYDPKFVYYSMCRDDFFTHMMNGVKGTKMPRGDKNHILSFPIPDYEISKEQQIASILTALDMKIDLNQRINNELELIAKTLYDYWFVQFDFPNEDGQPYKNSGGKMVWSDELKREIPFGWEVGTLLDIADYANGLPCQKFRPIGTDFIRVIKIKEMHEGFSFESERVRPDLPVYAIVNNGDVLFSWSASLEVQIWSGGKGALNQHIFKVTSDKYPKYFYFYQLKNYLHHFKMMAENRKTTMGHITQEHLHQSKIAIPPRELTLKLEKTILPIFEKSINTKIENQHLTNLRDWLLPMLMNGQVKVN